MGKRIAVIGAGPSGLATAKHILSHPSNTPVIYDSRPHLGGFWSPAAADSVHPSAYRLRSLRTNLSRWTCSFSDFDWKDKQAVFPNAEGVNRYLKGYAERFLEKAEWKLGCKVEKVEKVGESWKIHSTEGDATNSETFDGLVFAGGFFSESEVPDIPGLGSSGIRWQHAGRIHDWLDEAASDASKRKIVVVGGSFSAAEVVSELALQNRKDWEIVHISPRPFYTLPRYLPRLSPEDSFAPEFWPLDFVLYNNAKKKGTGLDSVEIIKQKHMGLNRLTSRGGSTTGLLDFEEKDLESSPWVAISEWYQRLTREEKVKCLRGHLAKVSGNSAFYGRSKDVEQTRIDGITDIIFASGYSPRKSLSKLLPPDLSEALSFDVSSRLLPLPLYHHQLHPALGPNCGFVGVYKGPYFGVIEAQAKFLADILAGQTAFPPKEELEKEIRVMISERSDPDLSRQTPPLSDYIPFMNTLTRTTSSSLSPSADFDPLLPVLFSPDPSSVDTTSQLEELRATLSDPSRFIAPAVFRALHGKWKVSRAITSHNVHQFSGNLNGSAEFTLRPFSGEEGVEVACPASFVGSPDKKPSLAFKPTSETPELVYTETGTFHTLASPASATLTFTAHKCYLYRLVPTNPPSLSAYFLADGTHPSAALSASLAGHFHELKFERKGGKWVATGKHWCSPDWYDAKYEFVFEGCELKEWELEYVVRGPKKDYVSLTRYTRPYGY